MPVCQGERQRLAISSIWLEGLYSRKGIGFFGFRLTSSVQNSSISFSVKALGRLNRYLAWNTGLARRPFAVNIPDIVSGGHYFPKFRIITMCFKQEFLVFSLSRDISSKDFAGLRAIAVYGYVYLLSFGIFLF